LLIPALADGAFGWPARVRQARRDRRRRGQGGPRDGDRLLARTFAAPDASRWEGAVTQGWNAALGELALIYPDRITSYL
jgi:hypothetical protein